MAKRDRFRCCGVRIDELGPEAAVAALLESRHGQPRRVHLCNSYNLAIAMQKPEYRDLLNGSDLNLADGHYVALVGRWRGFATMTERVYGPALMLAAMDQGRTVGLRHYLYGTTPETVAKLAAVLTERYPGVDIVGFQAPPFRELTAEEEADLHERIAQAKPDVVWVGIGTPRQDEFVARQAERLRCTLVPVGAAFDFHAGTKKAAPRAVQRIGMEWLFRLVTEPRRLWRRYLVGIPIFLFGVALDTFRRGESPRQATISPGQATIPPGQATIARQHRSDPSGGQT